MMSTAEAQSLWTSKSPQLGCCSTGADVLLPLSYSCHVACLADVRISAVMLLSHAMERLIVAHQSFPHGVLYLLYLRSSINPQFPSVRS